MRRINIGPVVMGVASLTIVASVVFAQQDRFTLKAPNGVSFAEFKGYDKWQALAPSETDQGVKVITGNAVMIKAFDDGMPGNGKPVPDGAMMAKIEWSKQKNAKSPYAVNVPDTLKSISFMEKDAKRFADTGGWGYAQFLYDASSNSFKPFGNDASFAKTVCHPCHTRVKTNDFVFTSYARR